MQPAEEKRPPKLLDRVREAIRVRHYSRDTEEAYVHWIRRYILFHNKRHPSAMGAEEVNRFLSHLACDCDVSASTQGQALSALLFLYKAVLADPLPWIGDIVRARRPERLPTALTQGEVQQVFGHGYDIRTVQELLGHASVETTMIYTHVLTAMRGGVRSPLDVWSEREPPAMMRQLNPDNAPPLSGSRRGITGTTPEYPDDPGRPKKGENGGNP